MLLPPVLLHRLIRYEPIPAFRTPERKNDMRTGGCRKAFRFLGSIMCHGPRDEAARTSTKDFRMIPIMNILPKGKSKLDDFTPLRKAKANHTNPILRVSHGVTDALELHELPPIKHL